MSSANTTPVSGQNPAEQVIGKLREIATQVSASIKTLGLHGRGVKGAKDRCNTILKSADTEKRSTAAKELAASLKKGNAEAHKLASAIVDVLQMGLPGVDAAGGSPAAPAPASGDGVSGEASGTATEVPAPVPYGPAEVVMVEIDKIKTAEPFVGLFATIPAKVAAIADDMRKRGFDAAHPVVLWKEQDVLLDGHSRRDAAVQAGLTTIPAVYLSFPDEDAALDYAIHTQRDRRNLTDADILCLVEKLDQRRKRGGDRRSEEAKTNAPSGAVDRSSEETAGKIGVSPRTVERARRVIASGQAELIEAVKAGAKTISKGDRELKPKKTAKKPRKVTVGKAAERAAQQLNDIAKALKPFGDEFKEIRTRLGALAGEIKTKAAEIQKEQADKE